jgi:hypothetical protein
VAEVRLHRQSSLDAMIGFLAHQTAALGCLIRQQFLTDFVPFRQRVNNARWCRSGHWTPRR